LYRQVSSSSFSICSNKPSGAFGVETIPSSKAAEHLDGRCYEQLVILGWDYEYNYDEILHERERASKRQWHTKIVSKTIPSEVYEYIKKAKNIDDVDSLNGKIHFYDKPYLLLLKPEILQMQRKYQVTVGIDRYVVFNIPIEDEEHQKEVQELVKDKPLLDCR